MDQFDKIYRRYASALRRFVEGMVKDAALSEDIVHNIFMRLLEGKMTFRSDESLRNWLYVCARNEVVSTLRSKWRSSTVPLSDGADMADTVKDDSQVSGQLSLTMRKALMDMPEKRAEVFRLCKIEHRPVEEVAARMGISVRTVEKHLQLAYNDIRRTIN